MGTSYRYICLSAVCVVFSIIDIIFQLWDRGTLSPIEIELLCNKCNNKNMDMVIGRMKSYFSQLIGHSNRSIIEVDKDPFFWLRDVETIKRTMMKRFCRNSVLLSALCDSIFLTVYIMIVVTKYDINLILITVAVIMGANGVDVFLTKVFNSFENRFVKASNVIAFSLKGLIFSVMYLLQESSYSNRDILINLLGWGALVIHQLFVYNKCQWNYLFENYHASHIAKMQILKWLALCGLIACLYIQRDNLSKLLPTTSLIYGMISIIFLFFFAQRSTSK